jgi:hypothetical protein
VRAVALVVGELLASPGIGQMREGGTGQLDPQQAVELAVEDGGGPCPWGSVPRSMSAGPWGWLGPGAQADGLEPVGGLTGAAHGDRNRPGYVLDRHSGVASMTSIAFRGAMPTPHSSCSRASIAPTGSSRTSPGHRTPAAPAVGGLADPRHGAGLRPVLRRVWVRQGRGVGCGAGRLRGAGGVPRGG